MNNMIEGRDIKKVFNPGLESEVRVLNGVDIAIKEGEFVSIMGPSGSGKSTLLDILGCLSKPTKGDVYIEGERVNDLSDNELAKIRGEKIGFVFQQYNLIPSFTVKENVEIALRIMGKSKGEASKKAESILKLVGLGHRMHHRPSRMSGGEQQRVAIARALANDPKIIFGDEPTGNLDTKTGENIVGLLKELNKKKGYTIVVVTHDPSISIHADKMINIMDGKIIKETRRKHGG